MEALGDKEGARTTYKEVTRRFPNTAAAAVAEERRAKLPMSCRGTAESLKQSLRFCPGKS